MDNKESRGGFAGNLGFILAAAGSAVGLGNLVKFPYRAAHFGGGMFVLVYLCIIVVIGFTVMLAEFAIGRSQHKNAVAAFRGLDKRFSWVGGLGVLIGFIIVCYYNVIGGWSIKYFFQYITGGNFGNDHAGFFGTFISAGFEPLVWFVIFMLATSLIVWFGVAGGIEKASKIMMPALTVLLIIVVIRSVTLPGAGEGLRYYLVPDMANFSGATFVEALAQAFFSLSLGMGAMVTYGSYLSDKENLSKNALIVPSFDTSIALLAGFAVLPAMSALPGFWTADGPALSASTVGSLFQIMPGVLSSMPLGVVFGAAFFLCVIFAALTSSISLLEGATTYITEEFKWSRAKTVGILTAVMFVIGALASLSLGGNITINLPTIGAGGFTMKSLFDFLADTPDILLMPVCALMICVFVGWIWTPQKAAEHIESNGNKFYLKGMWQFCVKYVAPLAILIILLTGVGILKY
jgi:NSS family neurotransmitter:Na+ symporter